MCSLCVQVKLHSFLCTALDMLLGSAAATDKVFGAFSFLR